MPSKSPEQAKLMSAIAHGWDPPMKHAPSLAVAREFHEADKRVGKYMHADGGSIQDIPDETTAQHYLGLISHAADRAASALGIQDPHKVVSRFNAGLSSQMVALDDKGRPIAPTWHDVLHGREPGIVNETAAIPAGVVDALTGASRALGPLMDRYLGTNSPNSLAAAAMPGLAGGIDATRATVGLLDTLSRKYDMAPGWSRRAEATADQTHRAVRDAMGLGAPHGWTENMSEAAGTMAGQIPLGAEKAGQGILTKLARSPLEWLGPTIRPSLKNYGAGTLAGGTLGRLSEDPTASQ